MSSPEPTIVWIRNDFRLGDNPALAAASRKGGVVIPVFIWSPEEEAPWSPGAASRYWLHQSLKSFAQSLKDAGAFLEIRKGASLKELKNLIDSTGADAVFWNRRVEPAVIDRDHNVERALRKEGLNVQTFPANLLFEPDQIQTRQGQPYRVFTPYWNECLRQPEPEAPEKPIRRLHAAGKPCSSLRIEDLHLEPTIDWTRGIRETWEFGEKGAWNRLNAFLKKGIEAYPQTRDRPAATQGVSGLSPSLHFGEISSRQIWSAVRQRPGKLSAAAQAFLRQLGWREFAHHLLWHFPQTADKPLREEFQHFPWKNDLETLKAWQSGRTGIPLVDAGMRELWVTGSMHNRVRMVVASFLVKNLLIPWQEGARWFWDTLVDADLANNTLGWQWTAGCGADAAPFFRIFNPVSQGTRFDADGEYVRRWTPEIGQLPNNCLFEPWNAPREELDRAGLTLGKDYPRPMVSLAESRKTALAALETMKKSAKKSARKSR